jgi:hypothetical protein
MEEREREREGGREGERERTAECGYNWSQPNWERERESRIKSGGREKEGSYHSTVLHLPTGSYLKIVNFSTKVVLCWKWVQLLKQERIRKGF